MTLKTNDFVWFSPCVDLLAGRPTGRLLCIYMGMCVCVNLYFSASKQKLAECWKHLFNLYVCFVSSGILRV